MTYVTVCAVDDVAVDRPLGVVADSVPVAVVHTHAGEWFAIYDICSHQDYSLSEGEVDGCELECWAHGSRFNLRTGYPDVPPATQPVPVYPVRIVDGQVQVDPDNPINARATEES